jgi:hypothetical protein
MIGGQQGVEQHRANPVDNKRCRRFLLLEIWIISPIPQQEEMAPVLEIDT